MYCFETGLSYYFEIKVLWISVNLNVNGNLKIVIFYVFHVIKTTFCYVIIVTYNTTYIFFGSQIESQSGMKPY